MEQIDHNYRVNYFQEALSLKQIKTSINEANPKINFSNKHNFVLFNYLNVGLSS